MKDKPSGQANPSWNYDALGDYWGPYSYGIQYGLDGMGSAPISIHHNRHHFALPIRRRLTHYEKRVAALISKEAGSQLRRMIRRRLPHHLPLLAEDFSKCLPQLASISTDDKRAVMSSNLSAIVAQSVRGLIVSMLNAPRSIQNDVAARVCEALADKASLRDAEFRLPPIRNDGHRDRPTLVQSRAQSALDGAKRWQRKLALAKTKVAAYRKKVNYYKKKGHI